MSGIDERRAWSYGPRISEAAPHGFKHIAIQFLFGIIGVALITVAAIQFHLPRVPPTTFVGPGTISLLYLIVIAYVSLRAGFVSAVTISLIAVFCMNYFVLPLVPSLAAKNPLDILATVTFLITAWIITGMVTRLREKCALLDALFEQAPPAIALMDAEARLIRVNREFTHVFGYTPQEALGRRLIELVVPGEFRPESQRHMELMSQRQRVDAEVVRQRKDGSQLHVLAIGVPVSMPSGQIAVYAMYCDISERKRADDALRELSGQLLRLQDEERRRLARELHDSTGQKLAALAINLSVVGESVTAADARAQRALAESLALTDQCLREIRTLAYLLHPPELEELGLAAAARNYVSGFAERSGIPVELELSSDLGRLPLEVETTLFRILQESLNNVHRHSGSPRARVHIDRSQASVTMEVQDEGQGMQQGALKRDGNPAASPGVGVAGMRERVRQLGGQLEIHSTPSGTTLKAVLPLS
jgi:two-component system, NarL family, sensor kinase